MKNIPLNIRIVSITPRKPGGEEYIRFTAETPNGEKIVELEMLRGTLADSLAVDARQGTALPATLRSCELEQDAPEGRTIVI